ncbi:MAG: ABC transporter permease [Cyanophyceae cyanobacterium]
MQQVVETPPPPEPPPKPPLLLPYQWQQMVMTLLRDPTLGLGLLGAMLFTLIFVAYPLGRVLWQAFFDPVSDQFSIEYFRRYFDPVFRTYQWGVIRNTLIMGLASATGGTALGFVFAFTLVRCRVRFARFLHFFALLPTISPPFAIALAAILLFGRSGLVTRGVLGMEFGPDTNDIYGLDGLIFVQVITFFPVAYLILRSLLERVDPALEEASMNLGGSRWHVFRTITLPLLIPGIAGSFLLLFVESLADLGNPLLLSGNRPVLSTDIFLAVNGQFDQHRGAAFSLVLLIPTFVVFWIQRYWVSKRSYISVTGKPSTGSPMPQDPLLRWSMIAIMAAAMGLVLMLYASILVGSLTRLWGIDYTPVWTHFGVAITRGLNPILSTTFLAAAATPLATGIGIVIAYLVVRKSFAGKQALDLVSNLGAAVPGTILGIGYIIAFINPPMPVVIVAFGLLAAYAVWSGIPQQQALWVLLLGLALGGILWRIGQEFDYGLWLGILGSCLVGLGILLSWRRLGAGWVVGIPGLYLGLGLIEPVLTRPLAVWGRTMGGNLAKIAVSGADMVGVLCQVPPPFVGFGILAIMAVVLPGCVKSFHHQTAIRRTGTMERLRLGVGILLIAVAFVLVFDGAPLALVGTPYVVIAAYVVRSLPASARAGMAALQQIDPSIEEASVNLGADAQTTFRKITIPLMVPALLAGSVFSFARHMTSLSAIIFLTTPKWPILTAWILSEVEQGGQSTAAAYSIILIGIVFVSIVGMYAIAGKRMSVSGDVDLLG